MASVLEQSPDIESAPVTRPKRYAIFAQVLRHCFLVTDAQGRQIYSTIDRAEDELDKLRTHGEKKFWNELRVIEL